MLIRKTLPEDVDTILNIFDTARQFMHATGNPTQWNANYPALEDLEPDIQNGNSYVCVENDRVPFVIRKKAADHAFIKKHLYTVSSVIHCARLKAVVAL